jgi:hypothetical protein
MGCQIMRPEIRLYLHDPPDPLHGGTYVHQVLAQQLLSNHNRITVIERPWQLIHGRSHASVDSVA